MANNYLEILPRCKSLMRVLPRNNDIRDFAWRILKSTPQQTVLYFLLMIRMKIAT